jgi:hypothetical protein
VYLCLLVFAHCGLHRDDYFVADAALAQVIEFGRREIKLHRRLFDAADDRAFGETGFDEFDDRVVRQALGLFELGRAGATSFGGRLDDANCCAAGRNDVVIDSAVAEVRLRMAFDTAARSKNVRAAGIRTAAAITVSGTTVVARFRIERLRH